MFKKTILFIIGFFLLACAVSYAQENTEAKAPVVPLGVLLDSKSFTLGGLSITTELYKSQEPIFGVAGYFENFFKEQGFKKIIDRKETSLNRRLIRFKRGDSVFSIALAPKMGYTEVVIARYSQPPGVADPEAMKVSLKDTLFALPKEDVPGKDMFRPPESVRCVFKEQNGQILLVYATKLSVDEIKKFYKKDMVKDGWQLENETSAVDAMEGYQRIAKKKIDIPALPFEDAKDMQEVIKGSYDLFFKKKDDSGQNKLVEIVVFPSIAAGEGGSFVQVISSS